MVFLKKFSPFGLPVWPAIDNKYMSKELYYIDMILMNICVPLKVLNFFCPALGMVIALRFIFSKLKVKTRLTYKFKSKGQLVKPNPRLSK